MSINDLAREKTTQQRQNDEQRQESVVSRSEENLETESNEHLAEEAREQVAGHRLHDEQRQEQVLSRAEDALNQ